MNNTLAEKVEEFYALKTELEELELKKEQLGLEIKTLLQGEPDLTFECDGYKATLVPRTTFTYQDETSILTYLIQKGLGEVYLTKKINTTKLNKELKTGGQLYESLKNYVTKTVSNQLNVSRD